MAKTLKRIGILTGGGDAPGLNAVIRAVVKSAAFAGVECIGLEDSFDGLIYPERSRVLTLKDVTGILRIGGTILGTTNSGNPFVYPIETADGGKSPAAELAAKEEIDRVRQCLGSLNDRDRQAVELSVYDGLSQSQIAEKLATPLGTIKSLIRRALIRLRDCMGASVRPALEGGAE